MRGGASLGCSRPQGRRRVSSGASQPPQIKEAQGGLVGPPKTKEDKSLKRISLCTQATPGLPGWDASLAPGNSLLGAFLLFSLLQFHRRYMPTPVEFPKRLTCLLLESGSQWGETGDSERFLRGLQK